MHELLKPENPAMRLLARVCDLMLLNVLFVAACCTVVPSGAAATALYAQTLKMVRKEEESVVMGFLKAMRDAFLPCTPATLMLFVNVLLWAVIGYALRADTLLLTPPAFVLLCAAAVLLTAFLSWLFPLIARYDAPFATHCKNALRLMVSRLPITCTMTIVNLLPILSLYGFSTAVGYLLGFWFMIGIAAGAWVNAWYLRRCFDEIEIQREVQP